mmetsp:Transcript_46029/g.82878  ORF Transcript_46029/g.82878 Transcript_46029/m.82878 type:complete len:1117 (+) Transcript_46029:122-3472(+)|eukprot:CAMPEP_0197622224 /NCGR_PEP_ID=MMETSP1338-20131121/2588_1 /TAXON_ID=43686 ORGANISM="Pelagodinium beii, Strain RCC1491" /NCGR_SAMPLE_ID=MMETSP1338 /ASSEMBLY_ACC=CAM_ASM_000754 /LENGTH=1116 /DNA_ID=CAMNT_0043191905 /DNA_START=122 /DNA_END=3472 /DNA_ORIENTATION=+
MAGADRFVELMQALQSPDNETRKKAETMYQQAKQAEPDTLMMGMMTVLGNPGAGESVRRHDCVLLRQLVTRGEEKNFCFRRCNNENKQKIAAGLLQLFQSEADVKLQKKMGDVISMLAEYVCDQEDASGHLQPGTNGWPDLLPLVFRMANTSTASSSGSCEAAILLLKDLLGSCKKSIIGAQEQLRPIIENGLSSPELKHKVAVLLLVCDIVSETEKKAWAPLAGTLPVLLQVLTGLAQAKEEDMLSECLQALIEVATEEPDFFKVTPKNAADTAQFMATVARSKEVADTGLRNLALEWLITFVEKKTKYLKKSATDIIPLTLEACMSLMLEIDGDEESLKAWVDRMDDEEGEEDEDELFHAGEETIDRLAEAVTMETLGPHLFKLIGHFSSQDAWQAKHAALAAVKQTVEYVDDKTHVDEMAKLLLGHLDHPHPRVRFTALHAVGQLANDQAPQFQESSHSQVMPELVKKMDDQIDRVAAMAMSAFVSFGEELDNALMASYARPLMEKLVMKLQQSKHRGVREEAITSIAVIAGVIEKDFSQYYDSIMPMLKQFVMTATGEKENRLRGKSFECMSLLGIAVGKEKFLPDAREAIAAMMNTQVEADDVQKEYIKEASERICTCLKKDFAPFLPPLLQGIFRNLSLDDLANQAPARGQDDDEDAFIQVTTGEGKVVNVHTGKFEDMMQSVQLLHTFCTEMESGYFDAVPETAKVLLPLLTATDEMSMLCDEVRGTALQVWALLIKAARLGAQERSQPNDIAKQLLQTGLQAIVGMLDREQETEVLQEVAAGMSECIKNVGPGVLGAEEIKMLCGKVFGLVEQSMRRSQENKSRKDKEKQEARSLQLVDDDDDEEKDPNEEEEQLRRNLEEVLGSMMEVSPQEFGQVLQDVSQRLQQWVSTPDHKVLGLYLACDMLQHLKDASQPVWPAFMPVMFDAIADKDPDARTAAAYGVNLAAPVPAFQEAAPEAFKRLAQVLSGPKPKKSEEKAKIAMDNAVAALLSLAKEKPSLCPPEVQAWELVLSKLPIKDDEDEAKKVHEKMIELVLNQNQGLLGAGNKNLGKVLSILAEIYKQENILKKENDEKIHQIFKMLPQNIIAGAAGSFTEKQQRKIEKMLSS